MPLYRGQNEPRKQHIQNDLLLQAQIGHGRAPRIGPRDRLWHPSCSYSPEEESRRCRKTSSFRATGSRDRRIRGPPYGRLMKGESKMSILDNRRTDRPVSRRLQATSVVTAAILAMFILLAAGPAGAQSISQTYYVPFPETQVRTWAQAIQNLAENETIHSIVSLTVTRDDALIYYDQWENDFDEDITDPDNLWSVGNPGGTQIWGDGDTSNGAAPGFPSDTLLAGNVLVLESDVPVPGGVRNPAQIFFDGGDKFATTELLAVTRAAWPSTGVEAQLGGAVEVFDDRASGAPTTRCRWARTPARPPSSSSAFRSWRRRTARWSTSTSTATALPTSALALEPGRERPGRGAGRHRPPGRGHGHLRPATSRSTLLTANENTNYEGRWYSLLPHRRLDQPLLQPGRARRWRATTCISTLQPGPTVPITVTVRELSGCSMSRSTPVRWSSSSWTSTRRSAGLGCRAAE